MLSNYSLAGNDIYLSAVNETDLEKMYSWINDKNLVNFNSPYLPVHFRNHLEWFENVRKDKTTVLFGIRIKSSNELIGVCQLHSIHCIHRKAELQIRIQLDSVSKGYGTEALRLLLNYGFGELNLNKIYLSVFSKNLRAIALYKKLGFVDEGVLREDVFMNNAYLDTCLMSILRKEWAVK